MNGPLEIFGQYKLLKRIAAGGMAEVFLAVHSQAPDKLLALKRILPDFSDNTDFIDQFQREAFIVKQLKHPGIVRVHDSGVERRQMYLSMEYIEGKSLSDLLDVAQRTHQTLHIDLITYLAAQIATAMAYAHDVCNASTGENLQLVHSDLSHHNVMVSFEGQVKIIDFGVSRLRKQSESDRAGKVQGKIGYLSPEQIRRESIDGRTDIFALGIMLWEMIAFESLFLEGTAAESIENVLSKPIPSLDAKLPIEFKGLEGIIARCLHRDPNARYSSMHQLRGDLEPYLRTESRERLRLFLHSNFAVEIDSRKRESLNLLQDSENTGISKIAIEKYSSSRTADIDRALEAPLPAASARRSSGFSGSNDSFRGTLFHASMGVLTVAGLILLTGNVLFPKQMQELLQRIKGQSTVTEFKFRIESIPVGADIFIDQKSTGLLTPALVSFKNSNLTEIMLRKKEYQDFYWRNVNVLSINGKSLSANLQKVQPAFLTFTSRKYKFLTVKIHGTVYEEVELPLKDFSVPAQTSIEIEAYQNQTGPRFKTEITLKGAERRTVELNF